MGYLELLVIFLGSIGLALLLGTGAAYLRYRRTGVFPGQGEDTDAETVAAVARAAKGRMFLGAALSAPWLWLLTRLDVFA